MFALGEPATGFDAPLCQTERIPKSAAVTSTMTINAMAKGGNLVAPLEIEALGKVALGGSDVGEGGRGWTDEVILRLTGICIG